MKRLLLIIALLFPVFTYAQKPAPSTYDLLIGTYTKGSSKGILVYRFYVESGRLAYLSQIEGVSNPSYLCVSRAISKRCVYKDLPSDASMPITGLLESGGLLVTMD